MPRKSKPVNQPIPPHFTPDLIQPRAVNSIGINVDNSANALIRDLDEAITGILAAGADQTTKQSALRVLEIAATKIGGNVSISNCNLSGLDMGLHIK